MIIMKIFIWLPGNLYMKSGIHPPQKAGAARRAASETADHNTSTTKKKKLIWMWLVVSTPLKNINQLDWSIQIDGTIKNVPSHQPDSDVGLLFHLFSISMMWNLHGKWMRSVLWIFLGNLLIGTKWRTRYIHQWNSQWKVISCLNYPTGSNSFESNGQLTNFPNQLVSTCFKPWKIRVIALDPKYAWTERMDINEGKRQAEIRRVELL